LVAGCGLQYKNNWTSN